MRFSKLPSEIREIIFEHVRAGTTARKELLPYLYVNSLWMFEFGFHCYYELAIGTAVYKLFRLIDRERFNRLYPRFVKKIGIVLNEDWGGIIGCRNLNVRIVLNFDFRPFNPIDNCKVRWLATQISMSCNFKELSISSGCGELFSQLETSKIRNDVYIKELIVLVEHDCGLQNLFHVYKRLFKARVHIETITIVPDYDSMEEQSTRRPCVVRLTNTVINLIANIPNVCRITGDFKWALDLKDGIQNTRVLDLFRRLTVIEHDSCNEYYDYEYFKRPNRKKLDKKFRSWSPSYMKAVSYIPRMNRLQKLRNIEALCFYLNENRYIKGLTLLIDGSVSKFLSDFNPTYFHERLVNLDIKFLEKARNGLPKDIETVLDKTTKNCPNLKRLRVIIMIKGNDDYVRGIFDNKVILRSNKTIESFCVTAIGPWKQGKTTMFAKQFVHCAYYFENLKELRITLEGELTGQLSISAAEISDTIRILGLRSTPPFTKLQHKPLLAHMDIEFDITMLEERQWFLTTFWFLHQMCFGGNQSSLTIEDLGTLDLGNDQSQQTVNFLRRLGYNFE